MPTISQLIRKPRQRQKAKSKSPALEGCPQKRGVVIKVYVINPKKPNSADRKVCRVRLSNGMEVTAYIPGEGHSINEHMAVLIRGGRTPDCPGVKYKVIRGALDDQGERTPHQSRRSKFGVSQKRLEEYDRTNKK
jgi:small subunit ribosomal protein S12